MKVLVMFAAILGFQNFAHASSQQTVQQILEQKGEFFINMPNVAGVYFLASGATDNAMGEDIGDVIKLERATNICKMLGGGAPTVMNIEYVDSADLLTVDKKGNVLSDYYHLEDNANHTMSLRVGYFSTLGCRKK